MDKGLKQLALIAGLAAGGYGLHLYYRAGHHIEAIFLGAAVLLGAVNYQHNTETDNLVEVWSNGIEAVIVAHLRAILLALYGLASLLIVAVAVIAALLVH